MREIKFRGKRKDNGEWVYGSLVRYENSLIKYENCDKGLVCNIIDEKGQRKYQVIPETVGEYTGKKDLNGEELWEEDIITHKFYSIGAITERLGVIHWHENNWKVNTPSIGDFYYNRPINKCYDIEKKGNIHDNPELVKEW